MVGRERLLPNTEGHERVSHRGLRDSSVGRHRRLQRDGAAAGIRSVPAIARPPAQSRQRMMYRARTTPVPRQQLRRATTRPIQHTNSRHNIIFI